jgi:NAD(P)-dependent dehydrogenase (short-subunit alcohol dehydrogenase family)
MHPKPETGEATPPHSVRLQGKVALITGGDSGIGRAVCILFAKEGADIFLVYLNEHDDARDTRRQVEARGVRCELLSGDVGDNSFCLEAVRGCVEAFGRLDILVNNAGEQHSYKDIREIGPDRLERTFRTNIFSMFHLTSAALDHMKGGSTIINTTSVTAYQGHPLLLDYSSTKGAIVSFTRSLALNLADREIRVNAVAPGPVWTPLIPASFEQEKVESFGASTPMGRAGQPEEIAPCYLFLACEDSSYITGQVLHPNGGRIVNG